MKKYKKRLGEGGKATWSFQSPPIQGQVVSHLNSLVARALPQKTIEDRVGLTRAYAAPDSIYVRGDVAYVAGTQISRYGENVRDMIDDIKIPLRGTRTTYRFSQLQKALKAHPEVTHLVGHSLGGAVILEAARGTSLKTTTYGAPVTDVLPKTLLEEAPMRFANRGDPVAMMDSKAQSSTNGLGNPHSFDNFHHTSASNSKPGYENADGSVTLFE
jgi:pimeloyl-ACP methyl ester carboxylesterase